MWYLGSVPHQPDVADVADVADVPGAADVACTADRVGPAIAVDVDTAAVLN